MKKKLKDALFILDATLESIGGCSDGNCKVYVRPGMHTNGGCRCLRSDGFKAERVVHAYKLFKNVI